MAATEPSPVSLRRATQPPLPAYAQDYLSDAEAIGEQPLPPGARIVLYMMLAFVVFAIIWASLSEIDRVVVARGKVVTTSPNIVVQPMETSVIRSIDVRVGQIVRKGQALGTFDPTFAAADVGQLTSRHQSLQSQMARLESELGDSPNTGGTIQGRQKDLLKERTNFFRARNRQFDENMGRLRASLQTNERDQKVLTERLGAITQIEQMRMDLLEREAGSRLKLLETKTQRLEIARDLEQARNKAQEIRRELSTAEAEKAAFTGDWRKKAAEDLVDSVRESDSVSEQLSKASRRNELQIMSSPVDAVVLEVAKRSVGSVVREAEQVFVLVPLDSNMEAEVEIEARDVGFVRTGDGVRLKLDSFPFQKHGTVDGSVRVVSEDTFTKDKQSPLVERGAEAYYVARIDIGPNTLKYLPKDTRFLPGMTLTAEIVVGKRTVMSYLTYPLLGHLDEAMQEP